MTRLAKAPSALTPGRHSGRVAVLALAMALILLAINATGASAEKYFSSSFGATSASNTVIPPTPSGTAFGGFFSSASGGIGAIAVNDSSTADGNGTEGWSYVNDTGNHRIQAFDQNGAFKWAIGRNVIAPSVSEVQILEVKATAGKFKLGLDAATTAVDIDWNTTAAILDTRVGELVGSANNVVVTGNPATATTPGYYAIQFSGTKANLPQNQITVQPGSVALTGTASVSTLADGIAAVPGDLGDVVEKCTVAAHCKAGTTGSEGGMLNTLAGISIDQESGELYVRERNSNARIQHFEADGTFIRAFGWDVVQPGGSGEVIDDLDEVQTVGLSTSFGNVIGGTFTLSFDPGTGAQLTDLIPFNAPPAPDPAKPNAPISVQERLEGLAAFAPGDVVVTSTNAGGEPVAGGPYVIRFTGAYTATNVAQLVGNGAGLTTSFATPGLVNVATAIAGGPGPGFETCTVATQCKASTTGLGVLDGQFGSTTSTNMRSGVTIAPAGAPNAGTLYAADPVNCRVVSFDVSSATVSPGESFGRCGNTDIDHFQGGISPGDPGQQPTSILAAPDGTVYASNSTRVNRYDTQTGTFLTRIEPLASSNGIALDPDSERLFVSQNLSGGVVEIDVSGQPDVLDVAVRTMDRHFANSGMAASEGTPFRSLALDPGTGRLFGATINSLAGTGTNGTTTGVSSQRVLVLDDIGMSPQPTVTMLPPEDVEATTATLKAQVNPNGVVPFPTSYRFQVSKDGGATWIDVSSPELVGGTGTGNVPVAVQKAVSNLEPGTAYLVRVLATRGVAGRLASAAIAMPTDPAPPLPSTGAAQRVADTSAQLTGTLNAGGLQTEYWFEWGEASLTDEVPVPRAMAPASGAAIEVAEALTGLDPDTTYQFRLCATNALELTPVCGSTRTLHTRQGAASPDPTRAYEMVTSAEKALRRGGNGKMGPKYGHLDYQRIFPGWPAIGGGRFMSITWAGIGDPDAGHGYACTWTWDVRERQPGGLWTGNAVFNVPPPQGGSSCYYASPFSATSANFDTTVFSGIGFSPFDLGGLGDGSGIGVRELDGTGGPLEAGWYPWLDDSWVLGGVGGSLNQHFSGVITDSGQQLAGSGFGESGKFILEWRDVLPADGGLAAEQLTPAQTEGLVVMRSNAAAEWRPLDLVNECTGASGGGPGPHQTPTLLPSRTAGGEIGTRECGAGSPTDVRGALLDSGNRTTKARTMSEDGRRIFFLSPDPEVAGTGQSTCGTGTDAATRCPSQLFVRAFDSDGDPVVRWISRAESSLFATPQQIGLLGNGVVYEGASKDGSVVYFRTNAPLTADDPNGGALVDRPVTTGTASPVSWDLYRYELPSGDADPGTGTLTRVTGGPAGEDDPNVSCAQSAADCGGSANGRQGNALRFLSDDGDVAYFASAGRIGEAADPLNEPPAGSSAANVAVDAPSANTATRNLYVHDAGSDTYRFVAALPFSGESEDLDSCASYFGKSSGIRAFTESGGRIRATGSNCVHGSGSADAIVFTTSAQLTEDDTDADFDVYAYDATAHELTRVSAPPPNTSAYPCVHEASFESEPDSLCNADMGVGAEDEYSASPGSETTADLHWNVAQDTEGNLTAVYFQTRLPLVENDSNSYDAEVRTGGMDVYQWRRADGRISLVSPGTSDDSAFFSGNSLDGKDVFFWTEQRISPWEIEAADGDIYNWTSRTDLRPDPPPPPPACNVLGGACQGQAPVAPSANGAASAQLKGEGNVVQPKKPRRCTKGKVRRGKRCVTKKQKRAKSANRTAKNDRRASR